MSIGPGQCNGNGALKDNTQSKTFLTDASLGGVEGVDAAVSDWIQLTSETNGRKNPGDGVGKPITIRFDASSFLKGTDSNSITTTEFLHACLNVTVIEDQPPPATATNATNLTTANSSSSSSSSSDIFLVRVPLTLQVEHLCSPGTKSDTGRTGNDGSDTGCTPCFPGFYQNKR